MFRHIICITPLGMMYGSAGAFLSPENLVGRSGKKFPPDAATLSGLIFSLNKVDQDSLQEEERKKLQKELNTQLSYHLVVAGPFWAHKNEKQDFYVPIPWTKIISKKGVNEWILEDGKFQLKYSDLDDKIEPDYQWQRISDWDKPAELLKANESVGEHPWKYVSSLHPSLEINQRCVKGEDGLFLENSVLMEEEFCLVYLSTCPIENGWYRFGGENHIVEIECETITDTDILDLLNKPIERSFALITPGVWGSTRFSYRYPQHVDFPSSNIQMLTDKPIPYRYRAKSQLGRGRYAVPAGSVYLLEESIGKSWWNWNSDWFPKEGFHLQRVGCGLCLPITIEIEGVAE